MKTYAEYIVYVDLPDEYSLEEVIKAGMRFLDANGPVPCPEDKTLEASFVDFYEF